MSAVPQPHAPSAGAGRLDGWLARVHPVSWVLAVLLIIYPWIVSPFFTLQIGAYSLILGTIALSLMWLAGYGGMVTLAQITVAGVAGYMFAIFGANNADIGSAGRGGSPRHWRLLVGTLAATLIGAISVRTEGIYTIMITLAIAVAFFYFAHQNYAIFNGFSGFTGILAPTVFGIDWRDPMPFYYLCLAVAAGCYGRCCMRSFAIRPDPAGDARQSTPDARARLPRDCAPRRRLCLAGVIAGTAGVLSSGSTVASRRARSAWMSPSTF